MADEAHRLPTHSERTVRVFVSSTFRDLRAERDELVLRVFPRLRNLCESRGVTWGEVDLRWGITDEQAAEGRVLPLCLREIERCRPFFIGILGERYGMVITDYPSDAVAGEPWLHGHIEQATSLTELEILHGVLNARDTPRHAFFYFRDPCYEDRLPAGVDRADFTSEGAREKEKLDVLKARICAAAEAKICLLRPEYFCDAKQLGQWVAEDLTALIDRLYPEHETPDHIARVRMEHVATLRSKQQAYVARQPCFDRLDAYVASDDPLIRPLVVLGGSGMGKTALLANWVFRYEKEHADDFVLIHFIGTTPDSGSHVGLLRRIMLELKRWFGLAGEVPSRPEHVCAVFSDWLVRAATRGRIVLVLDALNKIDPGDDAEHLGWLPPVFPRNVRLVVSTLPGPAMDALQRRDWMERTEPLTVQPLTRDERSDVARQFLAAYGRELSPSLLDRVVAAGQTANPLFLRVMLDELRVIGEHRNLGEQVDAYLTCPDPAGLYIQVIARWIRAYSEDRDLVAGSLRLLSLSRRGLSEAELLDLLGDERGPLPRAALTPFLLAAEGALSWRHGLLRFSHEHLRQAVDEAVFEAGVPRTSFHEVLADYFSSEGRIGPRQLEELPWQLLQAGQHRRLAGLLTELPFVEGLAALAFDEIPGYWRSLPRSLDPAAAYENAWAALGTLDEPGIRQSVSWHANTIGRILEACGAWQSAVVFYQRFLDRRIGEAGEQAWSVQLARLNYAALLVRLGRTGEAIPILRLALSTLTRVLGPYDDTTLDTAYELALALGTVGETDEVKLLYPWLLRAAVSSPQPERDAKFATGYANFLRAREDVDGARTLAKDALQRLNASSRPQSIETIDARYAAARLLCELDPTDASLAVLRAAVDCLLDTLGPEHPYSLRALEETERLFRSRWREQ